MEEYLLHCSLPTPTMPYTATRLEICLYVEIWANEIVITNKQAKIILCTNSVPTDTMC